MNKICKLNISLYLFCCSFLKIVRVISLGAHHQEEEYQHNQLQKTDIVIRLLITKTDVVIRLLITKTEVVIRLLITKTDVVIRLLTT
jgi:choline kinase